MLEMYNPKYVDDAERKTEIVMNEIGECGKLVYQKGR